MPRRHPRPLLPQTQSALVAALRKVCPAGEGWAETSGRAFVTLTKVTDERLVGVQVWLQPKLEDCWVTVSPPIGGRVKIQPGSVELTADLTALALGGGEQS